MLSKKYRLNRKEINLIYKKGRGQRFAEMGIKYLPNTLEHSRYCVVVPKALLKKTTDRNRIRRVIFDELSKIKPARNLDMIIRVFRVNKAEEIRGNIGGIIKSV